jgi:hypothetical protein
MTWLTLRQFRGQGTAMVALVGAVAVLFAFAGKAGPDPTTLVNSLYYVGNIAVFVLPALLGAFWGAPLVARELEAGTHNLVWNQGITRGRWLATKIALVGGAAAILSGLASLAVTWWSSGASQDAGAGRLLPITFGARGVAPAGYALFAFCLGLLAGILLRRVLPAMAVTLAVFLAVQIAVPLLVREHLRPATTQTVAITNDNLNYVDFVNEGNPALGVTEIKVNGPADAWVTESHLVDKAGVGTTAPPELVSCVSKIYITGTEMSEQAACLERVAAAGYRQTISYHSASDFWPLQWLELGLFLVLSGGLTGLAFHHIRKVS